MFVSFFIAHCPIKYEEFSNWSIWYKIVSYHSWSDYTCLGVIAMKSYSKVLRSGSPQPDAVWCHTGDTPFYKGLTFYWKYSLIYSNPLSQYWDRLISFVYYFILKGNLSRDIHKHSSQDDSSVSINPFNINTSITSFNSFGFSHFCTAHASPSQFNPLGSETNQGNFINQRKKKRIWTSEQ